MNTIYKTDTYLCEYAYPLSTISHDVLTLCYGPLMGPKAYTLYLYMYTEAKRMDRFHMPMTLDRLVQVTDGANEDFMLALAALEGLGLVRTYRRSEDGHTQYLFRVREPLSVRAFLKNAVLTTLLEKALGQNGMKATLNHFRMAGEDTTDYEEISHKFTDVFNVRMSDVRPLSQRGVYLDEKKGEPQFNYDFTLFDEAMNDYQIPRRQLEAHRELFAQMGVLYGIDALTLASLVRDAMGRDRKLDREKFIKNCRSYYEIDENAQLKAVYHHQSDRYKMQDAGTDKLTQHLKYLETISPYELLKNRQGGAEPILHDLKICENLMVNLGLEPGVVNVLVEYALGRNDNRLSAAFCETIGASWRRKHVTTVKEAYEECRRKDRPQTASSQTPVVSDNTDALDEDLLDNLLKAVEEGDDA